jgi:hypothetical protein
MISTRAREAPTHSSMAINRIKEGNVHSPTPLEILRPAGTCAFGNWRCAMCMYHCSSQCTPGSTSSMQGALQAAASARRRPRQLAQSCCAAPHGALTWHSCGRKAGAQPAAAGGRRCAAAGSLLQRCCARGCAPPAAAAAAPSWCPWPFRTPAAGTCSRHRGDVLLVNCRCEHEDCLSACSHL